MQGMISGGKNYFKYWTNRRGIHWSTRPGFKRLSYNCFPIEMQTVTCGFFLSKQVAKSVGQRHVLQQFHVKWNQCKRRNRAYPTVFYTRILKPGGFQIIASKKNTYKCFSFFLRRRWEKVVIAKCIILHSLNLQCNTTHFALIRLTFLSGYLEIDGQNIFFHKRYIKRKVKQKF